jgi:hypothetical protein
MKGKDTFTQTEISELRNLIKERIKAEKSRQKGLRAKMRKIGFYGLDDFGIIDMQPSDFERLINSGRIKVIGQKNVQKIELPKLKTELPKKEIETSVDNFSSIEAAKEFVLFYPEKQDAEHIPDKPGNYIVCLKKDSILPDIGESCEMKTYHELNVIYTGIAGKSLRKRDYRQHFTGNNAGSSTLRKSLGSMFGYEKIPRDKDPSNGKTKFRENDEVKLSKWMQSNLMLYFKSNLKPDEFEDKIIRELNPPLNLSKNKNIINQEFRKKLSQLRSERLHCITVPYL